MRRFFIDSPLRSEMAIEGDDVRHIVKVLRLQISDTIIVVDPCGQAGIAQITGFTGERVILALQESLLEAKESPVDVYLVQGLPKSDKMDYIVQKAVELGVVGIYPLAAEHCVVQYTEAKGKAKVDRWRKIAVEAAKQCGRSVVPHVSPIHNLQEVLNHHASDSTVIMLYEGKSPLGLKDVLNRPSGKRYLLLVGPEGGFSQEEVKLANNHGVDIVTMGPRILRTETAAVAAVTAVMYEHGDLGGV